MPALRPVRRSRRLTNQSPLSAYGEWEVETLDLGEYQAPSPTDASPASSYRSSPAPILPPGSHARKRKPGHIPRPSNAFMIFRSHFCATQIVTSTVERDHRHISRIAGHVWNSMPPADRAPFLARAREVKAQHAFLHPNYKYAPAGAKPRAAKRKVSRDGAEDQARCARMAALVLQGIQGDALERRLREDEVQPRVPTKSARKPRTRRKPAPTPTRFVAYAPSPPAPVKPESPHTPDLTFAPSPPSPPTPVFVPTQDIPALDLSIPGFAPRMYASAGLLDTRAYPVAHAPAGDVYLSPHWGPAPTTFDYDQQYADPLQDTWAKLGVHYPPMDADIFTTAYPFGELDKALEAEMQAYFEYPRDA